MATDSIREKIIKNRIAALEGITTANGYDNTVQDVQRFEQAGQTLSSVPVLLVSEGEESTSYDDASWPLVSKALRVGVAMIHRVDGAVDSRSGDEIMNSLRADVQRAMLADTTCGGWAIDVQEAESGPIAPEEGQPEIAAAMVFVITYRHNRSNPKSLT